MFGLFGLIAGVPRIQEIPGWQRFQRRRRREKSQGRGLEVGQKRMPLSNEKRAPGWLGFIGDENLPSYIGILINHYKDPY